MHFLILVVLFVTAVALAIPTFGISLFVFFLLKKWYDSRTVSAILTKAVASMREELTMELYGVNPAAINKLFDKFCVNESENGFVLQGVAVRWGVFKHPMINEGKSFSLRIIRQPRGAVDVKAAPGVNEEVLSDHLEGIGSFRLAALAADNKSE
jgi:hypothetical protein